MNLKKIAIIGVIALVVIGCVVAAGCTVTTTDTKTTTNPDGTSTTVTTTTTNGQTTTVTRGGSNDSIIVGTWKRELTEEDNELYQKTQPEMSKLLADANMKFSDLALTYTFANDGSVTGKLIRKSDDFVCTNTNPATWKNVGDNKFILIQDGKNFPITINLSNKQLIFDEDKMIFTKI